MPQLIWDTFPSVRRRTDYQEAEGSADYFAQKVWPEVWDPTGAKLVGAMDDAGVHACVVMPMDFGVALREARTISRRRFGRRSGTRPAPSWSAPWMMRACMHAWSCPWTSEWRWAKR